MYGHHSERASDRPTSILIMLSVLVKTDLTAELPDEVLCHVFSFLSLKDKLKSEAVSHKFQRCILQALKARPQPLAVDLVAKTLNGYVVPTTLIFGALQAMAKRAKFSSVDIVVDCHWEPPTLHRRAELVDLVLSLLLSENQCLGKVTAFKCNAGCSQDVLEQFLDKCDKLSTIALEFEVCPLNKSVDDAFPLDLSQLLENRPLTECALRPYHYQEGLVGVFQSIKTNTLRKVDLSFGLMTDVLNVADLVDGFGSSLEELRLKFEGVRVQLLDLLESFTRLPALRKCELGFSYVQPENQFVAAVTSLFTIAQNDINITVAADRVSFFIDIPGCQVINTIRQVQHMYPGMVVDFDFDRGYWIILSLGSASIRKSIGEGIDHCGAVECAPCQLFHALGVLDDESVISSLRSVLSIQPIDDQ